MDKNLVEFVGRWANAIGLSIQYIITGLFSRMLTAVVGGFFGINTYRIFIAETDNGALSLVMAIIAAGGVEAVGFMATHRAVKAHEQNKPMFVPILFVAVYLLVSIGALMFADVSLAYRFVSVGIVVMIGINYALIGMETVERVERRTEHNAEQRANELADEDREFAREMKRAALANRQAVKLAKVEVVRNVSATVEPETTQSRSGLSEKRKGQLADVYGHFADGQEVSVQDMANTLGVHERTARRVAADGVAHGVFVNPSRGVYFKNGVNPKEL